MKTNNMENFKITAVYSINGNCYHHFGIRESLASLYGDNPKDIKELTMKVSNNQSIVDEINTKPDYWGWYDNKKEIFTMIYSKRFLLEMCFPYGIKSSEETNHGKAYRLEIVE